MNLPLPFFSFWLSRPCYWADMLYDAQLEPPDFKILWPIHKIYSWCSLCTGSTDSFLFTLIWMDWLIKAWCISNRYEKAIKIYEEIARHSLGNNLLKYGVKGHLLNAGLCHLCKADVVSITNALEKYQVLLLSSPHKHSGVFLGRTLA